MALVPSGEAVLTLWACLLGELEPATDTVRACAVLRPRLGACVPPPVRRRARHGDGLRLAATQGKG